MFLYGEDSLARGAYLAGWVVEALHARGSMANLYRAKHAHDGRAAALKVLHQRHLHDAVALQRFAQERDVLLRVLHPAVVRCLDTGELPDGLPFLALEWLEGETLAQRVARRGPLSLADASAVLRTVCEAVEATHQAGLIHRDLKAENVFCLSSGEVKLLDFGIARATGGPPSLGLTSTGHVLGTPIALSPEQLRGGAPSEATDVYALGVLCHVMLAGRPPFEAARLTDLEALHLSALPPPLSSRTGVPPALDAVVNRCLEKEAPARYAGAMALWRAFEQATRSSAEALLGAALTAHIVLAESADDTALDAVDRLERELLAAFAAAGLRLVGEGALLLACRVVDEPAQEATARWRAFATSLSKSLPTPPPGVRVDLACHVAPAQVQGGVIVGGELLHPLRWPSTTRVTSA